MMIAQNSSHWSAGFEFKTVYRMFARRKALQSAVSLARLASAPSERLVATSTLGEAFSKARAFIDTPAKATNVSTIDQHNLQTLAALKP